MSPIQLNEAMGTFATSDNLPAIIAAPRMAVPTAVNSIDVYVAASGEAYSSTQAAIDSGADRVLVRPGIYQEVITLTTGVSVIGAGADHTYLTFPADTTSSSLVNVDVRSTIFAYNTSIALDYDGCASV